MNAEAEVNRFGLFMNCIQARVSFKNASKFNNGWLEVFWDVHLKASLSSRSSLEDILHQLFSLLFYFLRATLSPQPPRLKKYLTWDLLNPESGLRSPHYVRKLLEKGLRWEKWILMVEEKISKIDVVAICVSTHISFSLLSSSFCQRVSLYCDQLVDFNRQKASADHRNPTLPPIISLRIPCLANTIRSCSGE